MRRGSGPIHADDHIRWPSKRRKGLTGGGFREVRDKVFIAILHRRHTASLLTSTRLLNS